MRTTIWAKCLLALVGVQMAVPAFAGQALSIPEGPKRTRDGVPLPAAERFALRCRHHAPDRDTPHQGTLLWGTKQQWDGARLEAKEQSVLVSVDLDHMVQGPPGIRSLQLEGGRLVATANAGGEVIGTVLQGTASDGEPVEVAICGAAPSPQDPEMVWYDIEAWNPLSQRWENPCVATGRVPQPRALPVGGFWDASGAHQDVSGKFTFACANGAIAKCAAWGYQPWASRDGHALADLHQACTRMARADYCGNGRTHTTENTVIDVYDALGILSRATERTALWDPARASFEATWAPDGATCLGHTRHGQALETILQECPGRFQIGKEVDLGEGDRCTVARPDVSARAALLRNRSYGGQTEAVAHAVTQAAGK